ncbi:MAG: VWA domain-containing protein [Bryobacteraceae bacterium]|jgi:VWFA-related protein
MLESTKLALTRLELRKPRRLLIACLCALALGVPAVTQQTATQQTAPQQSPPPQQQQTAAPKKVDPLASGQPAQPQLEQGDARFTAQANDVIVPVTVTDEHGKYVSNLEAKDFRILDEGRPQKIKFFSHDPKQPVVIGFLVDTSSAMRIHWKTFQEAILELVWAMLPGDPRYTGYLITYGNAAELAVNTTQESDPIAAKLRQAKPSGTSALYDAIYRACTDRKLVPGEPYEPRRVIVVIGDGHDTVSKQSLDQVIELAQRNLVTIYAMSTENFGFDNESKDDLVRMAVETGGRVEYPLSNLYQDVDGYLSHPSDDGNYALTVGSGSYSSQIASGILKAVVGIEGDVQMQYVIRYAPDVDITRPREYRRITVDIPELPNVKIRAKPGYYPFPARGGFVTNQ